MQVGQEEENHKSGRDVFRFHHLWQLDGFRGAAVILVLVGHVFEFSIPVPTWSSAGADMAALGVFLFFVLSGFLITSLLYAEKLDNGNVSLSNFCAARTAVGSRIVAHFYW